MDEEYGSATRPAKRRPIDAAVFRSALLAHFDRHRRPLPWRADRNPYRVTVSEFMLQQTRVETVGPYYARWLQRFPDWDALAAAPLDDVLLEWEGLGYYSRARNLHRTARAVRERYGGELPADPAALRTLPGVGEYTAGAVASIAFGRPVPAVDGNVRRVLARLLDLARPTPSQL
ncbi:MAG: A/G-specific adenine glycosylase, partial [Gemmatimonadetes bacterium]|nr:A/G-specific adenine glycosylase [Gemmatimonadota bacterium]